MISQEVIAVKSSPESKGSSPKQKPGQPAAGAGSLIYDPISGSLRYPKASALPGGSKNERTRENAPFPAQTNCATNRDVEQRNGSSASSLAGDKLLNGHGDVCYRQSAESSPRCVIRNSALQSSTSTSPSGSKSVSEMDEYSDVKQLIGHNRSSSPSDADDENFFISGSNQKNLASSGLRILDNSRGDIPSRQKNVKGTGEQLAQKVYQAGGNHSRSTSTSSVPGIDSFQRLVGKDRDGILQQHQHETGDVNATHSGSSYPGSVASEGTPLSLSADNAKLDFGSQLGSRSKSRGRSGSRSSHSHELLNENGWVAPQEAGQDTMASTVRNSPLDPILESLMKASIMKDAVQFKQQQNQIAEKIDEMKRKNGMKSSLQSNSFSHGGAGAFSFNQTHFVRMNEADFLDFDSSYDTASNSSFDFNRGSGGGESVKGVHRNVLNNFAKPAPSKWDDAEKWLSSEPPVKAKSKSGPQVHPSATQGALAVAKKAAFLNQAGRLIPNITQLAKLDGGGSPGNNGQELSSSMRVLGAGTISNEGLDIKFSPDHHQQQQCSEAKGEKTKKVDSTAKMSKTNNHSDHQHQDDSSGATGDTRFAFLPTARPSSLDRYPLDDPFRRGNGDAKVGNTSPDPARVDVLDPALRTEKPTSDSPPKEDSSPKREMAKPDTAAPADAAPKVCMRDMGTAMTPVASVEPSRAPTPICARTPTLRSPSSSRPTTPSRVVPTSSPICEMEKKVHYTDKELQSKTRQEILALGTQLGKHNIAVWATKEEEEEDAFKSLKNNVDLEEVRKCVIATRAAAWEEAEQSKYMSRFKREEAKILAWENHEKAKAEAEIRRTEMKIERMRSHANEKLMNKLAATRRSAEELRAAAAARRGEKASKTSQRAESIRRTGKIPSSLFSSLCCS